jgi:abequosyltransferase
MDAKLSICIPIYNFGKFVSETLNSILEQDGAREVEIVILDGASTDDTGEVIRAFQKQHGNIKYFREPQKGGIDRDMATSVDRATGEYCWLFSGDDWMLPGALRKALTQIESGHDLYLCKHLEWISDRSEWIEWPTVDITEEAVFDLSDASARRKYFSLAVNSEAFFSFMGGLIVKRATWSRVPLNEAFVGSCWAHSARMFELISGGLTLKALTTPYLKRRPDNDSFASRGIVNRYRIAIEGFHGIADAYFGRESVEAFHIRRAIRCELHLDALLLGKFLCSLNPEVESRALMDHLVRTAYGDLSYNNLCTQFLYFVTPLSQFRRRQRTLCDKYEKEFGGHAEATSPSRPWSFLFAVGLYGFLALTPENNLANQLDADSLDLSESENFVST